MAGRFISRLTFSPEMPLGNLGICSLEGDDRAIVRGRRRQKAILLLHPLCPFFHFSPFLSLSFFTSPSEAFQKSDDSHLKGKRPRLTSVYFTLLISIPLHFIILKSPARQSRPNRKVSGKNVRYDSWKIVTIPWVQRYSE